LAVSSSHIADLLDGEIEKLQTSYKALSDRLLQQQRELEATQSQLYATKKLIDSFQDQRSTVKMQMEGLRGLMHPVRRLPVELLRAIFEATMDVAQSKLKTAFKLSHVCGQWRDIALDAPRLWSLITLSPFAKSDSFWTEIIPRMKKIPASINIEGIKAIHVPLLQKWRLSTIPNIEKLTLYASYAAAPQSVCDGLLEVPYVPLKELSFILDCNIRPQAYVDDEIRMGDFPSLLKLNIKGLGHLSFNGASSTLTTLIANDVTLDMETLMPCLQLETLKLRFVDFSEPRSQEELVFPNIRLLHLILAPLFEAPWAPSLRFPRLHSFYDDELPTDLFAAFVMSHPGIKKLHCFIDDGQLAAYAAALPAITSFSLLSHVLSPVNEFINWMEAGMSTAPFPSLKVLTLSEDTTLAEFEEVVCARCLPLDHLRNRIEPPMLPLEELRVILDSEVWEEAAWAQHEFARSASVEVIPYIPEEDLYCAALRW
jgi:F-box-like